MQFPGIQRYGASTGEWSRSNRLTSPLDTKVVYRRYASLFFIAGCSSTDNELITLEIVHRYVEQMDKYYGNVCELDIIFNFQKAYFILDEMLLAGEMQESSKKNVLRCISQQDSLEDMEVSAQAFHLAVFTLGGNPCGPGVGVIRQPSSTSFDPAGFLRV